MSSAESIALAFKLKVALTAVTFIGVKLLYISTHLFAVTRFANTLGRTGLLIFALIDVLKL